MIRKMFNWNFGEVERFLKENGFVLHHTNGSHYYFKGLIKGGMMIVCVPFHGKKSIKPRTLRGIILQSGIAKESWFK